MIDITVHSHWARVIACPKAANVQRADRAVSAPHHTTGDGSSEGTRAVLVPLWRRLGHRRTGCDWRVELLDTERDRRGGRDTPYLTQAQIRYARHTRIQGQALTHAFRARRPSRMDSKEAKNGGQKGSEPFPQ